VLRADHPPHDDAAEFLCRLRTMERHADAVLCSTASARRELVSHFPKLAGRCTVIHPPVSLFAEEMAISTEPEVERSVLARYGVESHGYLLYVGVIERKKNVRRLVDAYLTIREQIGIPLLLAGWLGYGAEDVQPALARGGGWLRHVGYVSQLDKIVLMRHARALVFPSLYEGFGLPPLEAMQVGCPVLASNIPAVAEACGNGAHLVDCRSLKQMADGLVRIVSDQPLRASLVAHGHRRAERLSLARYREQLGRFLTQFVTVPALDAASRPVRTEAESETRAFLYRGKLATDVAPAGEQ
jgi:glycosyltransferase involved in cell wall biosynthesis